MPLRRPLSPIPRAALRVCGAAPALVLAGCGGVLSPAGAVGAGDRIILLDSLAIMLAIVAPLIVTTLVFAWWFRASNPRAKRRPEWEYNGSLEAIVWSIPALIVMFLGGVAWVGSHDLDPAKPLPVANGAKVLEVQAVSLDWKWLFIYPEQGVATVNQLVIPAGTPVHFRLTSATVMNSFFVPRLGSQIYTMAGMATQLNLQADRPGVFQGLSAHFSGEGFAGMHFETRALPAPAFSAWMAGAQGHGPALDAPAYARLAKPSQDTPPATYGAVAPGLFDTIMSQSMGMAARPPAQAAAAPASSAAPQPRA